MAREVQQALVEVLSQERGLTEAKAEEVVKSMRAANQYQVCFHFLCFYCSFCDSCGEEMLSLFLCGKR